LNSCHWVYACGMPSDAEILEAARTRLLELLQAGVQEFHEGAERARMLELKQVQDIIDKYQDRAGAPGFVPIKPVDV